MTDQEKKSENTLQKTLIKLVKSLDITLQTEPSFAKKEGIA